MVQKSQIIPTTVLWNPRAVLYIYTYPSRIYKILNVLEPFSYAPYLVFVCESNAQLEYDSRPIACPSAKRSNMVHVPPLSPCVGSVGGQRAYGPTL